VEEVKYSLHALDMMAERRIEKKWAELAVAEPERVEEREDGTRHYIRAVEERGGRYLRVVLNPTTKPKAVITVFFDRRLERKT